MKRLLDLLHFQFGRLGWPGALGIGLIAAALAADFLVLRPGEAAWAEQIERNRIAALAAPDVKSAKGSGAALPVAAAAEEVLRQLFAAAAANGLVLDQGDYTLSGEKAGDLHRYQISLPVAGSYPALRAFLAQALNDSPALALGHVEMERAVIEDAELVASLRFTLFLDLKQREALPRPPLPQAGEARGEGDGQVESTLIDAGRRVAVPVGEAP
jgi:hypothetical protein